MTINPYIQADCDISQAFHVNAIARTHTRPGIGLYFPLFHAFFFLSKNI
jgi:hypothetical protein